MSFIKKCGIMLEPQQGMSVVELLDVAKEVERLGYGYLLRSDHLMDLKGRKGRDSSECWVTLGALAAHTKSLKLGPLVSPIGFRNPAILARMAWSLHTFIPGRLQLGVGAGWYKDEYDVHGLDFPSFKIRDEEFGEALQIIRPFTQGESVDFHGKHFSAKLEGHSKGAGRIHLVIGGRAPSIIKKAGMYADELNIYLPSPEQLKKVRNALESADRKVEISQMGSFIIAEDESGLRRRARAEMRRDGVSKDEGKYIEELRKSGRTVETEKNFADRVNERREIGIEKIYFQVLDTDDRSSIELLASVLKRL